MSGFVAWLAARYSKIRREMPRRLVELRESAIANGQHKRTPDIVASIFYGLEVFGEFAEEIGVFSPEDEEEFRGRCWRALGEAAAAQPTIQAETDPVERFCALLTAAVSSGRAHIADPKGDNPTRGARWGWRRGQSGSYGHGDRIGWVDGENLYLEPEAAYAVAQRMAQEGTEPLSISSETLRKRLHEKGKLLTTDTQRKRLTIRKTLEGRVVP